MNPSARHTEHLLNGDQRLGLGLRGSAIVLLVLGVFVLAAWMVIPSGSTAPAAREASPAVREQILRRLYTHSQPPVAVFVLANNPHRAAVCTAPGRARFLQEKRGRWKDEGKEVLAAWAETLGGACPYIP